MSISRQAASRVRSYSITHPPVRVALPTEPGWDYLVFAHTGLFTALTESVAWTIPAHRALCVPDGTRLRIETPGRAGMRCLYLDARLGVLSDEVRVVNLTPLARELTLHAIAAAPMDLTSPADAATITLLADQIALQPGAPLHLPLPDDPVARNIAEAIMSNPADPPRDRIRAANANRRTIERRFNAETGMSLGKWRRRARVLASVARLADGESVTNVAVTIGYSSPSSFVAAFRAELGTSPRDFLRNS
jgi:AraC-like DNA-binding protein